MKPAALKLFLYITVLEGFIALVWLLRDRSMERNALVFGYSAGRIALAAAVLLVLLCLTGLALLASRKPGWAAARGTWLDEQILSCERLVPVTALLALLILGAGSFLLLPWRNPTPATAAFLAQFSARLPLWIEGYQPALDRIRPQIVWLALIAMQGMLGLGISYPVAMQARIKDGTFARIALAAIITTAALAHWAILTFRLKTLLIVPGWKWYFHVKELYPGGLIFFAVLFVLTILLIIWFLHEPGAWRRNLVLLILLGCGYQIAFGTIEGGGFESLRIKYADSVFNGYAKAASTEPGLLKPLRAYESLYAQDWYLGTKPPGVLLVYILTQKFSNLVHPVATDAARFLRLTTVSAYFFPLLSFLVLVPLFHFSKAFLGERDAILPGILYIVLPNILLIPLFLDQVLYPLVFVAVLLLFLRAMQRQSLSLAFLSGICIYGSLYLSFSLLPLLPLPLLWLGLDTWFSRRRSTQPHTEKRSITQALKLALALLAGLLVAYLLFRLLLNYDIFIRYARAMAQHIRAREYRPGLDQVFEAIQLNNIEFATWSGLPITILFGVASIQSVWRWLSGKANRLDSLLLAFLGTYAALNLAGQTRGEVQRLWLFMTPLVCLFSARDAKKLFRNPAVGIALVAGLELVTAFLIFWVQDFYG